VQNDNKLRLGSLFSGAGGLDLAVEEVFNARTVWHSEIDPAASKVLSKRWPGVPNLGDITKIDWHSLREGGDANGSLADVDILCGGFP
jgi:DNA (cytosine-5)-methyltransferase 1